MRARRYVAELHDVARRWQVVRRLAQDDLALPAAQVDESLVAHPLHRFHLRRQSGGAGFAVDAHVLRPQRSEEHTSELQSLLRISYAVFCLKPKQKALQRYK